MGLSAAQRAGLRAICFEWCPRCHGTGNESTRVLEDGRWRTDRYQCTRCLGVGKLRHGVPTSMMCVRCGGVVTELPPIVLCPTCQAAGGDR